MVTGRKVRDRPHGVTAEMGLKSVRTQTRPIMNSLHKPTLFALVLSLLCAFAFSGCNTMKGLGKDTERVGEKIQNKANR